jgi:hypothetical protein
MKSNEIEKLIEVIRPIRLKIYLKYQSRFGDDLGGCCAIASGILFEQLSQNFKNIKIVISTEINDSGCSHCFLIYKGYIIDITATQFGHNKEILIFKDDKKSVKRYDSRWYWYGKREIFKSVKENIKNYLKTSKKMDL